MELLPLEDLIFNKKRLFLELLLHFLSDQLRTLHVVSLSPAVVRDTHFISVRPRAMELLSFEDFISITKRLFRELLLHFLSNQLQTSHVVSSSPAVVHDTNFIWIGSWILE